MDYTPKVKELEAALERAIRVIDDLRNEAVPSIKGPILDGVGKQIEDALARIRFGQSEGWKDVPLPEDS